MGKIFICYRRDDSKHQARLLHEPLIARFGDGSVFWDVDAIPFAVKFPERIRAAIAECDVLLALIGEHWADARDKDGNRRLDNPNDYVRLEIEEALRQEVATVPILLDDAIMPSRADFPATCRELAEINAPRVRYDSDFNYHVDRLLDIVGGIIAGRERQRAEERARQARELAARDQAARQQERPTSPDSAETTIGPEVHYRPFSWADGWISIVGAVPWWFACYYVDKYVPGGNAVALILLITAVYLALAFWQIFRWRKKTGQSTPMDAIRGWLQKK